MRVGRVGLAIALLLGACKAQIAGGGELDVGGLDATATATDSATSIDSPGAIDASPGAPGDAAPDAAVPIDAPPVATCSQRSLFLNFDGQALQRAAVSDATTNHASWMQIGQGTAPRYRTADPARDAKIAAIVDGVRSQLAAFPITVVTARPASGEYAMVVLGGQPNQVGSAFGVAVTTLDCDDSEHNDVAWIDDDAAPNQHVINLVIGAVGFGLGLTAVNNANDCMCGWANNCASNDTTPCTLGSPINRDPNANARCAGVGATQDEVATLRTAFCGP